MSSAFSELIRLARSAQIGFDLAVQSSDVAPVILSNTANKFLGRCGSYFDYEKIGRAMGLERAELKYLHFNLRVGQFACQIGESDWRRVFLIQVPYTRVKAKVNGASGEFSKTLDEELLALPTVVAEEFIGWQPTHRKAASRAKNDLVPETGISDAEFQYIDAVVNHPGTPSSALAKIARLSTKKAQQIRRELVQRQFLREHTISTSRRGRAAIVLEPLAPALEVLRKVAGNKP